MIFHIKTKCLKFEKTVIFCQISKLNKANFGIIYIQDVTQRKIRKQILTGNLITSLYQSGQILIWQIITQNQW